MEQTNVGFGSWLLLLLLMEGVHAHVKVSDYPPAWDDKESIFSHISENWD